MNKSFSITNRKGETFQVLVSADKYEEVMRYKWHIVKANKRGYYVARSVADEGHFYLHWQIMGKPSKNMCIDHRDGNGLNNTNENLRLCTKAQNCQNRGVQANNLSGLKGAHYSGTAGRWVASARVNGKIECFGTFNSPEEAHAAYCIAMRQYHGEYFNNGGVEVHPSTALSALYRMMNTKRRNRSMSK